MAGNRWRFWCASLVRDLMKSLNLIPFGAVVLAEPGVPEQDIFRDLENIRSLHFNTIVLYPSVSRWEGCPPGSTAFGAIDRIMDRCAELGLKVILELQGQVMQDADAPECSGYHQSPDYRENGFHDPAKQSLLHRYLLEVASHFKGHPALLAYDIFNEIGNNSRSPGTIHAFCKFLQSSYDEDIQKLNSAWATYFPNFEAIAAIPPDYSVWTWSSVVAERDWQRFRSADFSAQIASWRKTIRAVDKDTPLFVDVLGCDAQQNRTSSYYGVSDWDAIKESDILGLSCYANMLARDWWNKDRWMWPQFWRHGRSVAEDKQVIISELMTPNRSIFPHEHSSMTDELRLWSYQAIFHGIQGVIYWKYRPFRRGRQVAGRGLTDFSGKPNAQAQQAAEVARFVNRHHASLLAAYPDTAGCAVLFDPDAERLLAAINSGLGNEQADFYTNAHRGWYHALWSHAVNPTYVTPERLAQGVPEAIHVLVAPCLPNVSRTLAEILAAFLERGGILLTDCRFGIIDDHGNLWEEPPLKSLRAFQEKSFSSRFCGRVGPLTFHNDYFQELRLADNARPLLLTDEGWPALAACDVAKGRHLHLPFLLGHKASAPRTTVGTLALFPLIFEKIKDALTPAVEILGKSHATDVSVLLHPGGSPFLVGICNYSNAPDSVTLRPPRHMHAHLHGDGTISHAESGLLQIEIPARGATAVILHP